MPAEVPSMRYMLLHTISSIGLTSCHLHDLTSHEHQYKYNGELRSVPVTYWRRMGEVLTSIFIKKLEDVISDQLRVKLYVRASCSSLQTSGWKCAGRPATGDGWIHEYVFYVVGRTVKSTTSWAF